MRAVNSLRLKKIQEQMSASGYDLFITSAPENIYYLSNFRSIGQKVIPATQLYGVIPANEDAVWLVAPIADVPTIYESGYPLDRVVAYGNFYFESLDQSYLADKVGELAGKLFPDPLQALVFLLEDRFNSAVNIGVDTRNINVDRWGQLVAAQHKRKFSVADSFFYAVRKIKEDSEIVLLEKAAEIAEDSMFTALKQAKPGMTENDLRCIFETEVTKRGADNLFAVFSSGERAAYVDTHTTGRLLKKGDLIRCDLGCTYQGYKSDLSRTAVIGRPDKKQQQYYDAVLRGQKKAIEIIKPGVRAADVYDTAMKAARDAGLSHYKRGHCGHGIGLEVYEPPSINNSDATALQAGMVICVETPYYEIGWGGVQVEDMVLVTDSGSRLLSKSEFGLIVLD